MKDHNVNDELLTKYLLNELSESEEKQVIAWLNESKDNAEYFERLKQAWNLAGSVKLLQESDINEEWNRHARVREGGDIIRKVEEGDAVTEAFPLHSNRRRLLIAISVAASVLLGVGLYVYLFEDKKPAESLLARHDQEVTSPDANAADDINKEQNTSETPRSLLLSY